jgi:hypothetical protein
VDIIITIVSQTLEKKNEEEAFEQSINPDLEVQKKKFPGLSIPDEAPMRFDITDKNVCKNNLRVVLLL